LTSLCHLCPHRLFSKPRFDVMSPEKLSYSSVIVHNCPRGNVFEAFITTGNLTPRICSRLPLLLGYVIDNLPSLLNNRLINRFKRTICSAFRKLWTFTGLPWAIPRTRRASFNEFESDFAAPRVEWSRNCSTEGFVLLRKSIPSGFSMGNPRWHGKHGRLGER
jgi:hypothetical protein